MLWLNSPEQGIFIDPDEAVAAIREAKLGSVGVNMAATDVWNSRTGFARRAPETFRRPRQEYIQEASQRIAPRIAEAKAAELPAGSDLPDRLAKFFNEIVGAQTPEIRKRIAARLAIEATGRHGGAWTVDFNADGPNYVKEGLHPDWTYRVQVEDKLLYPFVTGAIPFFEDCSFRCASTWLGAR